MTEIVETVTAATTAELRRRRDAAIGDVVELRLDGVADVDVAGALAGRTRPAIVTCRPAWEGGRFAGDERTRLRWLADAVRLGAEYVDVEAAADGVQVPRAAGTTRIVSMHDFDGVPCELARRVQQMRTHDHDIVKVAVTATRLRDCLTLRDAVAGDPDHVAIAMGPSGWVTRVCAWLFGSRWTYGGGAAPGQFDVRALIDIYRVSQHTPRTQLFAVAGQPLGHSASPAMHNAAFAALEIDAVFVPLETGDAADWLETAAALGVAGASVTAPLKAAIAASAGVQGDETAAAIGAINTLKRDGDRWQARNFDADAFLAPLMERGHEVERRQALVIGAGGAARAAAWALRRAGALVTVVARREDRAGALARDLDVGVAPWPPAGAWDVVVQATPVGTGSHVDRLPVSWTALRPRVAYDLVYNPIETAFLATARAAGAATIGGLDMLVAQAARQFEWWTDRPAPVAVMAAAARAFVEGM